MMDFVTFTNCEDVCSTRMYLLVLADTGADPDAGNTTHGTKFVQCIRANNENSYRETGLSTGLRALDIVDCSGVLDVG